MVTPFRGGGARGLVEPPLQLRVERGRLGRGLVVPRRDDRTPSAAAATATTADTAAIRISHPRRATSSRSGRPLTSVVSVTRCR